MATVDSVLVFLVSLLIGGLGIHAGAMVVAGSRDYGHAVVTAGIGALVWSVVSGLAGGLLGSAMTLLAYLLVIKWRYRTGWLAAGGIALVAWLVALVVLSVLASLGYVEFDALGVPGT
jgi:hypothetical protein